MTQRVNQFLPEGVNVACPRGSNARGFSTAGITKKISFHCSRHTFGSLQVDAGTSVYTVQHMLGHKNVSTTQIYANMADESKRESVNRITLRPVKTVELKVVGQ